MDVVLFHSHREELPNYLEDNFRQFRVFNPEVRVHFITDVQHLQNPLFAKYNIIPVNKDDYYSDKISLFNLYFKYSRLPDQCQFWVITATRLMYIENFIRKSKLSNVYHFENDILIYYDLHKHHHSFVALYPNMAITIGGPDKCITGILFIQNRKALENMTKFFIDMLHKYSKIQLIRIYKMDMVNEMTLMRAFSKDFSEQLEFLPILPFGEWSKNYNYFNSVFDPASYGQFVGGNAQEQQPGLKPEDHYIGTLLRTHPDYDVIWKEEEKGRVPYFKYDGKEVRINNLHIHSKELYKYLS
jgi:hypothetical protein